MLTFVSCCLSNISGRTAEERHSAHDIYAAVWCTTAASSKWHNLDMLSMKSVGDMTHTNALMITVRLVAYTVSCYVS
jgi:hypothetical protein